MHIDAVDLEVVKASLSGIVREMQNSLFRTGFSTIVRESQDASCALMNAKGEVVAQHVVLPLHIGAFPACCGAVIAEFRDDIAEGDAFLINHPYYGGSPHAPDMCVLSPVFVDGELFGFCGSIAHKSDIGGPVPGSCSGQAREVFNEGLHLPPVRYHRRYQPLNDIERIIGANSRTPELVLGDIRGQLGSDRLGERRLNELAAKYGKAKILACFDRLFEISETRLRKTFTEWKDGRFEAERFVDDDGIDLEKPVRIHVVVEKKGDRIHFDFSGSADQTKGPANVRPPLVQAACAYCLISLIDPHTFVSQGLLRAFTITARDGSVLNPRFPAPVNTYNPTVHALVDAVYDALSNIVPDKVRADGSGSRSIILGGRTTYTGKGYVQYEIIAGGAGARATKDGASGITVNQSNAMIAPIEIIESEFPTRLLRFDLIKDSGGAGRYPRRPRHPPRISQSRGRTLLDPFDEARDPAERLRRRHDRTAGRHLDQSGRQGRQAPADPLRRLSLEEGRRLPARYAGRRRPRRCAEARARTRAGRCARGRGVTRRGGTRIRRGAQARRRRFRGRCRGNAGQTRQGDDVGSERMIQILKRLRKK